MYLRGVLLNPKDPGNNLQYLVGSQWKRGRDERRVRVHYILSRQFWMFVCIFMWFGKLRKGGGNVESRGISSNLGKKKERVAEVILLGDSRFEKGKGNP